MILDQKLQWKNASLHCSDFLIMKQRTVDIHGRMSKRKQKQCHYIFFNAYDVIFSDWLAEEIV